MQTRDQHSRRPKDWKVIAALTAASALGISGLAFARSDGSSNPDPIDLKDRTAITSVTTPSVPTTIAQLLEASADMQSSLDSPFDDADLVSPGPASVGSPASADSPAPAAVSADTASADSAGSTDNVASVASASADSAGSSDNSADS